MALGDFFVLKRIVRSSGAIPGVEGGMIPGNAYGKTSHDQFVRELSHQYSNVFRRYFYRATRSHAEAEDLTQELFVRVIRKRDIQDVLDAEPYLFRIAINLLKDRRRRRSTSSAFLNEVYVTEDAVELISPERVLQSKQTLRAVLASLNELDSRSRDMFILQRIEGMKYAEIAALYGISVSAVEKHIIKCLAMLARGASIGWK
ncbi:RNA polymerase sigma factor [Asticcacaulis sp.]|uniref:RNA polymerase sigma factor n=1 Tax=Asticcacaulis sp. TaxID=1872648 RepID=UPI0026294EC0|nr:RNA polymerase sigma factor [Asticcacaulis sp.]